MNDHGLTINLAKCQFGRSSIVFLGHDIDQYGVSPLPSKVEAIHKFSRPSTFKGLQEFIGMVTFYHCFVAAATRILQPFFKILAKNK